MTTQEQLPAHTADSRCGAAAMAPEVDQQLLTDNEVQELTKLSRRLRSDLERSGDFPSAIRVGYRTRRYLRSEILAWIREKAAAARKRNEQSALRADFI